MNIKLRYFSKDEINAASFGCDDGYDRMDMNALLNFDELRHSCGFVFKPTCCFRTKEWDISKGRSGNSYHTKGLAMDIACDNSIKRGIIISKAIAMGAKGIGVHKDFVHVDWREGELKIWAY